MNTLTICTVAYPKVMAKYFLKEKDLVIDRGNIDGMYYICTEKDSGCVIRLRDLMESIILHDNPVLAESEKVFNSVAELAFRPTRSIMKAELQEFISHNDSINIDGYIGFRLRAYSEKINSILYSIVKKNLHI